MSHIDVIEAVNGRRSPDLPLVVRLLQTAQDYSGAAWEPPIPLDAIETPVDPFPVDALPEPLRSFVATLAEAHQVDAGLPGALVLAAVSGLLVGKVAILHGGGARQEAGLFVAVFARSGERKSAVLSCITDPLIAAETEAILASEVQRRRLKDDLADAERRVKDLRERKAAAEEIEAAYRRVVELEAAVRDPRYIISDGTMEAMVALMARNGGRLLVASAEGDIIGIAAGRYADGEIFEALLRAYSGDSITSLRVNRVVASVERPAAAVALAVQPDVIREIAKMKTASGKGLLARFLFAMPPSRLGMMAYRTTLPDQRAIAAYRDLVRRLAAIPLLEDGARRVLRLDPVAEVVCEAWHIDMQEAIKADPDNPLTAWWARAVGHLVRIAGVLHACSDPDGGTIGVDAMERASAILRWFKAHTEALMPRLAGETALDEERARLLLKWIAQERLVSLTVRDAHRRFQRHSLFRRSKDVSAALSVLEEHGYVRQVQVPTGGRPATVFEVNPQVTGDKQ